MRIEVPKGAKIVAVDPMGLTTIAHGDVLKDVLEKAHKVLNGTGRAPVIHYVPPKNKMSSFLMGL